MDLADLLAKLDVPPARFACDVCGAERDEEDIDLYRLSRDVQGVSVTRNVRYCRDREACQAGAPEVGAGFLDRLRVAAKGRSAR